ncbi:MAG: ABC transporter ATP-binding protein [Gemmatimonadetes bacterium]|nr:ABC transporter ATP-binding protein [Gemmatimonadota bacterium]NNM03893.1 ABC transporter ATP-binding protein [Gemmatimonadota bacterium]
MTSVFKVEGVSFRYPTARREALSGISLEIPSGEMFAILGPNGSGKSTLLQVMLGELSSTVGNIEFLGRSIQRWSRRAIAGKVAFVPQGEPLAFPLTVRKLVEMGRFPHVGILGRTGPDDEAAVEKAMKRAGVHSLAGRLISTLSGGERQRARIARALAQEPSTLVLDEPTAALDLHYEMETFELMRELATESGFTVVVATHNLNLAARYSSRLVLLDAGRIQAEGEPASVLTHETVERVYRWPVVVAPHPGPGPDSGSPQVLPLSRPR